jgi:hypothetical protein
MRLNFSAGGLLIVLFFAGACASSYKPINLQNHVFSTPLLIIDSVYAGYATNLHDVSDNGWYARKERKRGMVALGVRIQNRSNISFVMEKQYVHIYAGDEKKIILTPDEYTKKVKQRAWLHGLHALYGIYLPDENGGIRFIPVGAGVAILNIYKALKANRAHAQQMEKLQLWGKTVPAKGEIYGIILVEGSRFEDYVIRFEAD